MTVSAIARLNFQRTQKKVAALLGQKRKGYRGLIGLLRSQADVSTPECRLIFAVIETGICDAMGMREIDLPYRSSGKEFLKSERFEQFCHAVGLDPVWVREKVRVYETSFSVVSIEKNKQGK